MDAREAREARGPGKGAVRVAMLAAAMLLALAPQAQAELEFLTQWGAPGPGEVVAPLDVERDSAGNAYVVDALTRSVQKYDSAGNFVLRWGSLGNGAGQFEIPSAIGINETSGHVYVGDIGGRVPSVVARIQRFDANGNFLDQFGSFGTAEGQFGGFIRGIAVHPTSQDLFVAEGHRIQRFSASGQFERMWGKDVQAGNANTGAETCTAGCKAGESGTLGGEFASPHGVAASGFGVFVTEDGNRRVQRFTVDGAFQLAGGRDVLQGGGAGHEVCAVAANCKAGLTGTGNGELNEPQGIDVDTDAVAPHNVYIVDQANHRVQNWDVGLNYLGQFGSAGFGDGQFQIPDGVAESQGNLVVTDPGLYRVQRFTGAGVFQGRFGEPGAATLVIPEGIGTGAGGVYVSDDRDRVVRFDAGGGFIGAFGSEGTSPGQFVRPAGVASDGAGNVYVADRGNFRIQRFDASGAALGAWGALGSGPGEFDDPRDVATGPGGEVYVIENGTNSRIQKFSQIGAFMGTWGAPGTAPGQFSGDGIATDPQGNVYVADTGNDRIQKFDPNGSLLTAWGSPGTGSGEFNEPADVAVDGVGNVYVVDKFNNRVQRFASNGTFLGRWGANGGDGTTGDGPGEFANPSAIAVDEARDIYVLDFANSRVQKFARANAPDPSRLVPDLRLGGRKRQDPARLRVKVDCGGPPCDVTLSGKVIARGAAGGKSERIEGLTRSRKASSLKRKLKPRALDLAAGEEATVRLKLKRQKSSLRMIESALARGAKGKAVIRAKATNDAGSDAAALRVKLKP